MAEEEGGTPVALHVYDLSGGLARALGPALLGKALGGVWHTGVAVFGEEYFFGDGICVARAGGTHHGTPQEVLPMGVTQVPRAVLLEWVEASRAEFSRSTYSLLHHNCNHFSDALLRFLVGGEVPAHIKDLPQEVLSTPLGALLGPALEGFERELRTAGSSPLAHPAAPLAAPPPPRPPGVHPRPRHPSGTRREGGDAAARARGIRPHHGGGGRGAQRGRATGAAGSGAEGAEGPASFREVRGARLAWGRGEPPAA